MDNKKFNELIEEFCVIPLRNIILEVEEWNDLTELDPKFFNVDS